MKVGWLLLRGEQWSGVAQLLFFSPPSTLFIFKETPKYALVSTSYKNCLKQIYMCMG